MAEIVNLRTARKLKARAARDAAAAENRATFGRTKADKQAAETETARHQNTLDNARRDP